MPEDNQKTILLVENDATQRRKIMLEDNQKTILLVEDDATSIAFQKAILEKHGYRVISQESGEQAIDLINNYSGIDLILMDIVLGEGIDGTQTAIKILENHDIPIIFVSSHTDREFIDKTENIGSYGYIVKNSGANVLIASIKMAFKLYEAKKKEEQKESALKKSEKYLNTILHTTADGFWIVDVQGKILEVNEAYCNMTGYTRDELLTLNVSDLEVVEDFNNVLKHIEKIMTVGSELFETSHRKKNGEIIAIEISTTYLNLEGGRFISFCRDISERKRTEDMLRTREQLLELAAATSLVLLQESDWDKAVSGVLAELGNSTNTDRVYVFRNHTETETKRILTSQLYEWSRSGTIPQISNPLLQNSPLSDLAPRWIRLLEAGYPVKGFVDEFPESERNILEPQNVVSILVVPIHIQGRLWGFLGFDSVQTSRRWSPAEESVLKITAASLGAAIVRKQTEDTLIESERKYRNLFDNAPIGVFRTNSKGEALSINTNMARILGFKSSTEAINNYRDLGKQLYINPEKRNEFIKILSEKEIVQDFEYEARDIKGNHIWLSMNARLEKKINADNFIIEGFTKDITSHKRAEEALIQSERRLRTVLETMSLIGLMLDLQGNIIFCNDFLLNLTGWTREEIQGHSWFDYFLPDNIRANIKNEVFLNSISSGDMPIHLENEIITKKGEKRIISWNNTILRDFNGNITGTASIGEDITDRKRAEEALEKRIVSLTRPFDNPENIHFDDLFNPEDIQRLQDDFAKATGVASIITRTDGTPITKPSNFCRLCNDIIRKTEKGLQNCYKSDTVLGRMDLQGPSVQECMSGGLWDAGAAISVGGNHIANWLIGQVRDETQSEEKIRAYARQIGSDEEVSVSAFYEVPQMSKEQFSHVAKALFTLANEISTIAYQNVQQSRFITDIKQAREALKKQQLLLSATQKLAKIGGWEWDTLEHTMTWTDETYSIHDLDPETIEPGSPEHITRSIECYAIEDQSKIAEAFRRCVDWGESYDMEFPFTSLKGRKLWIRTTAGAVFANNKVVKVIGNILDITDRKSVEEEQIRLQLQLNQAQKMESIGRLAGGVAHDFNNMLQVIIGNIDLIQDEIPEESPLGESIKEIRKCALRSANLTRQLLAFARKQPIIPKELDLNETIEGMLKMLRRLIGEDIELSWSPATRIWSVFADPTQIDQILANLCLNARDAIKGVGKISIETGITTLDEAYCSEHAGFIQGDFIVLSVSDNGCGMDKEALNHVFEPFYTTKKIGEGTGLGLSMIYGAVKQNNGFINVYSEIGSGTTFTIYLPRYQTTSPRKPNEFSEEKIPKGNETILIVEDEPAILSMTQRLLTSQGYNVLSANSPGKAIHLCAEFKGKINLLITDVIMPDMNGKQLASKLQATHSDLKCLFMSGYTSNVIVHHGVLEKGVQFIQKPFSLKDLASSVRKALESK